MEEGGKDRSIDGKISSPARLHKYFVLNYCLIHCYLYLHIFILSPRKSICPTRKSIFSEAHRFKILTQQPSLPSRKTCSCKNKALRFLVLFGKITVYQSRPFMFLDSPGAFLGPPANHMEGPPAQPVDLDQWRAVCALAADHLPQGLHHVVSPLATNRFERTPSSKTTTR